MNIYPRKQRKRAPQKRANQQRQPKWMNSQLIPTLSAHSFVGEAVFNFTRRGTTQILTTTAGAAIAFVYAIGNATSQVIDWTDISNSWDQYVLLTIEFEIICQTPPTPGTMRWFFDGSGNSAVPVAADEGRDGVLMTNHSMNANKVWKKVFRIVDPTLLSYRNTTTDYVVGYFKGITNTANFGTTAVSTALYQFRTKYRFMVRGRKM